MDFDGLIEYNMAVGNNGTGGSTMNENEKNTEWEDHFTDDKQQVANMDKDDFLNLLMESRIIQAS